MTQYDVMHFYRDLEIIATYRKEKKPTRIKTNFATAYSIFGTFVSDGKECDFEWFQGESGWHDIKPILKKSNGNLYNNPNEIFLAIKNHVDVFGLIENGMAIDHDEKTGVIETLRPRRLINRPTDFVNECPSYWWMFRRNVTTIKSYG